MPKLNVDKQEADFLDDTIKHWQKENLLDENTAYKLRKSYDIKHFDWRKLAQYSFWIALACGVIAISSLIIDEAVITWLKKLYDTPDIVISLFSGILAAFLYYFGNKKKQQNPERIFSNEAIIFLGVILTANSVAFLGKTFDNGSGHFSILFLISVFIYGFLGIKFKSKLVWAFALISLGSWFGTETGYQTHWGDYFFGMNYPLRFAVFGAILVLCSYSIRRWDEIMYFYNITYIIGFLYLFISLWLLSIFGNFATLEDWLKIKQLEIFYWGLISAAISIGFMLYGLKYQDDIAREFGITFLIINVYTRYFEYFWDITNKAIFFSILAASFWIIGRKAEKIWNILPK